MLRRKTRAKPNEGRKGADDDRMPWEREEGESDPAWQAFRIYRDLGLVRSTAKVRDEVKKNLRLIHRWSSAHHWRERVEAWDCEQDRVIRAENLLAIRTMQRRHATAGRFMMSRGLQRLQRIPTDVLYPSLCLKLIDLGCRLEARSNGEPEEHLRHDLSTRPGDPSVQYIVFGGKKIEF